MCKWMYMLVHVWMVVHVSACVNGCINPRSPSRNRIAKVDRLMFKFLHQSSRHFTAIRSLIKNKKISKKKKKMKEWWISSHIFLILVFFFRILQGNDGTFTRQTLSSAILFCFYFFLPFYEAFFVARCHAMLLLPSECGGSFKYFQIIDE